MPERDPLTLFRKWYRDATAAGTRLPEAMALATATRSGKPSVRMVLLGSLYGLSGNLVTSLIQLMVLGLSSYLILTGNFTVGGQIVDGPDGKKIVKGGDIHKIVLGEMYHIPIKTVHWVVPNPGTSVTYWVTNIYIEKP